MTTTLNSALASLSARLREQPGPSTFTVSREELDAIVGTILNDARRRNPQPRNRGMRTREEQIAELVDALKKPVCRPDYSADILSLWLEKHILEAERRAEQRVRAEIGRDSERLDWLADAVSSVGGKNGDPVVWKIMFTTPGKLTDHTNIRAAIDAAREVGLWVTR